MGRRRHRDRDRRRRHRRRSRPEAHIALTRRPWGRVLAAGAALLIIVAVALGPSRPVSAHAELLSSEPAAGSQLDTAPRAISLRFSEAVTFVADSLRLIDAGGTLVEGVGAPVHSGGDASLFASLPALADGGYVVAWTIVSADGHPASGAFTFVVGRGVAPDASVIAGASASGGSNSARIALRLLRGVGYLGLTMSIGLWAFVLLVDRHATSDRLLRTLVTAGGALVAVSTLGRIPAQAAYTRLGWQSIVEQDVGTAWIALAFLGAVVALAPLDWGRVAVSAQAVVLTALAVGAGVAVAYGGHGAVGRAHTLGLVATTVHVVAVSVWTGGLVGLARRWSVSPPDRRWIVAGRFSNVAIVAVAVVVVSGVAQSLRQLDDVSEVTGTEFGRTLLIKVGLVVILLAGAVVSRRSVSTRQPRLGRSLLAEIGATLLILGVTGFLAGASPVEAGADAPSAASETPGGGIVEVTVGDRVATITVTPGTSGSNEVDVSVFNRVERGELPDEMAIEIAPADGSVGAIDLALEAVSASRVIAGEAQFTFAGPWTVTVRARYGEFESVAFVADVTIAP